MNKFVLSVVAAVLLTGCGPTEIGKTSRSIKGGDGKYSVVCIEGVEYVMYSGGYRAGITVKLNKDGSVSTCGS